MSAPDDTGMGTGGERVLESTRDPKTPLTVVSVVGVVLVFLLARSREPGWIGAALLVVLLVAAYATFQVLAGRVEIRVAGPSLTSRTWRGERTVDGADVTELREVVAGRSPDHQLVLADGRKIPLPTGRVRAGHSTVFRWVAAYAPQAILDKRSSRTREVLQERGLLAP